VILPTAAGRPGVGDNVRVPPWQRLAIAGAVVAGAGALLLASPLHLAGAITLLIGVAIFCYARPVQGLWLVLVLSAVHPLVAKFVEVNLGATGSSLVVFSAWKELALATVLLADFQSIALAYRAGRRWRFRPGIMDVMAIALIALMAFGLTLRHDLAAINEVRLLLFPVGVYFAIRFSPVDTSRYFKVMVLVAAGIAAFAVIQSSLLGWSFIVNYWGIPADPLPTTFIARDVAGPRASGTFGSPNELGFALIAWATMAGALLVLRPGKDRWLVPALGLILVGLALTFSRSAVGAAGVGVVVIVVAAFRLSRNPRRVMALLALGIVPAVLLSGGLYYARGGISLLSATVSTIVNGPGSAYTEMTVEVHSWIAGEPQAVTVTVSDGAGVLRAGYRGTVHFTTSDPNASLPADYTFTASDAGTHTFSSSLDPPLDLVTAGRQWVRVTDTHNPNLTGQALDTLRYPPSTTLVVSVSSWAPGISQDVTVTAMEGGVRETVYRGTVHFTTTDSRASVPVNYTFTVADAGSHTFASTLYTPLILMTPGIQTVRATDVADPSVTGEATGVVPASGAVPPAPVVTAAPTPFVAATPPAEQATSAPSTAPSPGPAPTPLGTTSSTGGGDPSAAAHINSLSIGWALLQANPLGTGLGTVGPRPLPGTSDFPPIIIESYYLGMGVSLGWLGLAWAVALPLAMLLMAILALRRGRTLEGLSLLAFTVSMGLISYVLPTMMEPQMAMIPWSICALAASSKLGSGSREPGDTGEDGVAAPGLESSGAS
jgi:hypothetical protein